MHILFTVRVKFLTRNWSDLFQRSSVRTKTSSFRTASQTARTRTNISRFVGIDASPATRWRRRFWVRLARRLGLGAETSRLASKKFATLSRRWYCGWVAKSLIFADFPPKYHSCEIWKKGLEYFCQAIIYLCYDIFNLHVSAKYVRFA